MRLAIALTLVLLCTSAAAGNRFPADTLGSLTPADTLKPAVPGPEQAAETLSLSQAMDTVSRSQNEAKPAIKPLELPVYDDAYLDTVRIDNTRHLNDYTLVGVNGGVTFSRMQFNPSQKHSTLFTPSYYSVTLTRYGKMFGYMPYFGFQTGLAYGHEGFLFKPDSETGNINTVDGASRMVMDVVEVPFLAQIHVDSEFFKLMVNAGIYGGYRTSVTRSGPSLTGPDTNSFRDIDIRFDYGLQGGIGIGFVFDPIEIHFNGLLRYSWSSIYTPDSSNSQYNQYYYRFAYPFDIMVTAGIHFQLTRRYGKTNRDLRREAREIVYNVQNTDSAGPNR